MGRAVEKARRRAQIEVGILSVLLFRCGVLLSCLALASCASPKLINTGNVAITSANNLPPPQIGDLASGNERPEILGPFDKISVDVFGLPDLSREVRADAEGHVSLPLAGTIEIAGRTPEQVAQLVEQQLRVNYVKDPRVSVGVVESLSQNMAVDGEVRKPGLYPVVGDMTLMRAIARAEGTSDTASTNHVVVFRTVAGKPMAALYDLRAIRLGAYRDPKIYPKDVVVVGESSARKIFPQVIQAGSLILTPIITILTLLR